MIAETLKSRNRRDGHRCRLLEREIGWLRCQSVFTSTHILGKASLSFSHERCPKHGISWTKSLYNPGRLIQ
jgi:hypothetical protein